MNKELKSILSSIPLFDGVDLNALSVERLGGLTNLVYQVNFCGQKFLLRVPGEGTDDYIDRNNEYHSATVAAAAGVSPAIYHFDAKGIMLAAYIDGETLSTTGFKNTGSVERSAKALYRIHNCGFSFKTEFDVFQQIDEYMALLQRLDATLPNGYELAKKQAETVRGALATQSVTTVPCHCDPLAENFIDTGERVFIVDWEYAGNNDPMWDLGDLSIEAEFDADQDEALLQSYFNATIPIKARARMVMYKMLCDLLWTLWGLVQHANNNPADDFEAYANTRFARCKTLLESNDFEQQISILKS